MFSPQQSALNKNKLNSALILGTQINPIHPSGANRRWDAGRWICREMPFTLSNNPRKTATLYTFHRQHFLVGRSTTVNRERFTQNSILYFSYKFLYARSFTNLIPLIFHNNRFNFPLNTIHSKHFRLPLGALHDHPFYFYRDKSPDLRSPMLSFLAVITHHIFPCNFPTFQGNPRNYFVIQFAKTSTTTEKRCQLAFPSQFSTVRESDVFVSEARLKLAVCSYTTTRPGLPLSTCTNKSKTAALLLSSLQVIYLCGLACRPTSI